MANEIRLRRNNIAGTITDNPLLVGSTTINSPGFVDLPVVDGTNHLLLILDPLELGGTAEIVMVTAHTVAASSVTVIRGMEGSGARQHALATTWFHGPVASDVTLSDVTSAARPTTPYRGELIFETDTNSYVGRTTADIWQTVVPLGAWTDWVPAWTNLTVGNAVVIAKYSKLGRTVHIRLKMTLGTTTVMGNGPEFSLPFTLAADYTSEWVWGSATYIDTGVQGYLGEIHANNSRGLLRTDNGAGQPSNITAALPFAWGNTDQIMLSGTYEAAS